jgi:hypothetical protein
MAQRLSTWILACTLLAAPVWAGIGDPIPANPCSATPLNKNFRVGGFLAVLDVSGGGCGGPAVQTAITCTLKRASLMRTAEDIAVEIYSESTGASITGGAFCVATGLPEGSSVTMVTGALPAPSIFGGAVVIPAPGGSCGPGCFLHGTARVFSTGGVLQCTAARVDLSEVCFGGAPVPTTQDLIILSPQQLHQSGSGPSTAQRGD